MGGGGGVSWVSWVSWGRVGRGLFCEVGPPFQNQDPTSSQWAALELFRQSHAMGVSHGCVLEALQKLSSDEIVDMLFYPSPFFV